MDSLVSANEQIIWLVANFKDNKKTLNRICEEFSSGSFQLAENADDKAYKPSEFNYIVKKTNSYVIYNTLYNSLFRFTKREYSQYAKGICNSTRLRHVLVQNGFWVSATLDERRAYRKIANSLTYSDKGTLSVTMTTTLKCNAHCPYCYEHGVGQQDLSDDMADRILAFIESMHPEKGLTMTWFGGEPLMNMPVIDRLCRGIREKEIEFTSNIITNGSLFTEENIKAAINNWNLDNVQITIDGPRDYYEKIKNYDKGTGYGYEHILHVVRQLAENGVSVNIRMNISKGNLAIICQLVTELDATFEKFDNVNYYPAFVSGMKEKLSEQEKLDCMKRLFDTVSNPVKITASSRFHSSPRTCACNNYNPRTFTIDVSGNIFSCEHDVGVKEKAMDSIYDYSIRNDPRRKPPRILKKCRSCVFFPKCFGGCKANMGSGDEACFIDKYILKAYIDFL